MSKKYEQTQEAKEEFESKIYDYLTLSPAITVTKEELMSVFGMSERAVRMELEKIANYYPVRATAGRKGYSIIRVDESMSKEELENANLEAALQIAELQHRIDCLKARMKPLIGVLNESNKLINK